MPRLRAFIIAALLIALLPAARAEEAEPPAASPPAQARALAEILQDPKARQALIDSLLATAEADAAAGPQEARAEPPPGGSLARQFAEYTRGLAESSSAFLTRVAGSLADLASPSDGISETRLQRLAEDSPPLLGVIAVTLAAFWIAGALARRAFRALALRARDRGLPARAALLLGSSLVDALLVVAAWGGGYVFALVWFGRPGRVEVSQGLFLNAFLIIELVKVVLRGIFAPSFRELRVAPMSDATAGYWYFWLSRIVGIVGYGLLLVVPLADTGLSYAIGRSLRVVIPLLAAILAVVVIARQRRELRTALFERAAALEDGLLARFLRLVGRLWHVVAILYVLALLAAWVLRPYDAVGYILEATALSAVAIVLGSGIAAGITRAMRLPLAESRLKGMIPAIVGALRWVVLGAVLLAIGHAWELFDLVEWLTDDVGREIVGRVVTAAVIVLVAVVVWLGCSSWIERRLNPNAGRLPSARTRTLLALFRNAFTVAVAVLAVMLALSELGIDIGPLLAGAGVVGLAIGFGAQKLVQDIITGVFIQFENAMNEGDVVTAAGITGVVEKLTIRSVALRDLNGVYHLIPFSSVDTLSNFMRGFGYHVAEIGVAYRENIPEVKAVMQKAFDELLEDDEHGPEILPPFEMHGLTQFGESAIMVRGRIKTRPGSQWAVGRAYNEILKRLFDEAGIEIPFPHLTLYMGEDKEGNAPPMRIRNERPARPPREAEAKPAPEPDEAPPARAKPRLA